MSAGAAAAMHELLLESSADLLGYLERRVWPRDDAADLLAETMLTAWRRVDELPADPERRRMWLFVTAVNVLANHRRSARRRLALADRLRGCLTSSAASPDLDEVHTVRESVRALPEEQRELVMLVHWDGFTVAEAAQLLGLNASTARSRHAAAKATLRERLAELPIG